jgi:hypothetical protein
MNLKIKRKLYTRGSSYETTLPMPMLFSLDMKKKHKVIFEFNPKLKKWVVDFEEYKK